MTTTVGIDIGTSSVKAIVADENGQVLSRARVEHAMLTPQPDRLEHDAVAAWRDGPRRALEALGEIGQAAAAVGVSAMVPSMTAVDDSGTPIAPGLLYGDARGRTPGSNGANPVESGEAKNFLTWCAKERPDAAGYWSAQAVGAVALGGKPVVDVGTAFTSFPLYNGETWDPELLSAAGARPEQLPLVGDMGANAGETAEGKVLVPGTVDAIGEQIVSLATKPGDVLVMFGTTLMTWALVDSWLDLPPLWTIPWHIPDIYVTGGPSDAGGLFQSWVRRSFAPDGEIRPDRIPVWQPYLRGERVPLHNPQLRASLHGLDLTMTGNSIIRAGYEAAGFVVRDVLDRAGLTPSRLIASGGGVRVEPWVQAVADVTGLPIDVSRVHEGGALGMAWLGRMALGLESSMIDAVRWAGTERVVEPDPAWTGPCSERFEIFRALQKEASS